MTTACCIDELDRCLFEPYLQGGIIAHTLSDAQDIFQDKLKFTFDNIDVRIRDMFQLVGDSARELAFKHGSLVRVGTSLRSSTLQFLHITEYGKICAKYPDRAREIRTGSLNTVPVGQSITIESTAEGKYGHFYELCELSRNNKNIGPLDFKFFFFPWWKHPEYVLEDKVTLSDHLKQYFDKLALEGIVLTDLQKNWYAKKYEIQKEDMFREYPSKPEEAFQASQEGFWYASEMKELYDKGQITNVGYDRGLLVHTAWDLGQADKMAIWFFQITKSGDKRIIDYFSKSDVSISLIASILKEKNYTYGTHIWPFDANARDRAGITFVQQAASFGLNGYVLESHNRRDGIQLVRSSLSNCWFDGVKCKEGIRCLENYKKRWSSAIDGYSSEPEHDEFSHGADAFRYLCAGIGRVSENNNLEGDAKALRKYWGDDGRNNYNSNNFGPGFRPGM